MRVFHCIHRRLFHDFQILLAALLLLNAQGARAAVPTSTYRQWQRAAPEVLTIEVMKVTTESTADKQATKTDIVVTAKVRSVTRSKSGVEQGSLITISYSNVLNDPPVPGEGPTPLLKPAKTYTAYLIQNRNGEGFELAAGASSFHTLAPPARKNPDPQ